MYFPPAFQSPFLGREPDGIISLVLKGYLVFYLVRVFYVERGARQSDQTELAAFAGNIFLIYSKSLVEVTVKVFNADSVTSLSAFLCGTVFLPVTAVSWQSVNNLIG